MVVVSRTTLTQVRSRVNLNWISFSQGPGIEIKRPV